MRAFNVSIGYKYRAMKLSLVAKILSYFVYQTVQKEFQFNSDSGELGFEIRSKE